ncbi:hypothetical protein BC829DRAFT_400496 [Chytridium lagenaria]|nr:hypothetical protein BC829DRAFT_400496 [Chytridium lagenaria]
MPAHTSAIFDRALLRISSSCPARSSTCQPQSFSVSFKSFSFKTLRSSAKEASRSNFSALTACVMDLCSSIRSVKLSTSLRSSDTSFPRAINHPRVPLLHSLSKLLGSHVISPSIITHPSGSTTACVLSTSRRLGHPVDIFPELNVNPPVNVFEIAYWKLGAENELSGGA